MRRIVGACVTLGLAVVVASSAWAADFAVNLHVEESAGVAWSTGFRLSF